MRGCLHVAALMLVGALLSACGGGGGGGSVSSGGGSSLNPQPNPAPNITSQSAQRADSQASITALKFYRDNQFGSGASFSSFALERKVQPTIARLGDRAMHSAPTRIPMVSGCSNSTTTTYVTSGSSVIFTIDVWNDTLCATTIQAQIVWTASQQGSTIAGPMTITEYGSGPTVTETGTGQIEATYADSTLQTLTGLAILVADLEQNGQSQGGFGIACSSTTSSAATCGLAAAVNDYAASVEEGASISLAAAQGASTGTLSMQVDAYQTGLSGLSLAIGTLPNFTVSPASAQTAALAISASANASAGTYTLAMSDSLNGGSLTISGSASGAATGTLSRTDTGATVASFTVDANGNGTLTYSSGTQVPIVDYAVQG